MSFLTWMVLGLISGSSPVKLSTSQRRRNGHCVRNRRCCSGRMALQHLWPHGPDWRESLQHLGRRSRRSHHSVHLPRGVPQQRPRVSKRPISPRCGAATLQPTLVGIREGNRNRTYRRALGVNISEVSPLLPPAGVHSGNRACWPDHAAVESCA